MDTKWKSLKKSKGVKALLIIAYLICFCAMGIITGFAPANGYLKNGTALDTLFADNYYSSKEYAIKIRSACNNLVDYFNQPIISKSSIESISNNEFQWKLDELGEIDESAAAVYRIEDGVITAEKGSLPLSDIGAPFRNGTYWIAFTESQLQPSIRYWEAVQWNLRVIVVSDIALLILSAVILAMLCRVVNGTPDDEKNHASCLSVFYEIEIAAFVFVTWVVVKFLGNYDRNKIIENLMNSELGRSFIMCIFGLCFAAEGILLLWLICSIASRSESKTIGRGSLIYRLLSLIWRGLKFCGKQIARFGCLIKELFTGELFKATAAKKLGIIDLIYIAAMLLLGCITVSLIFGHNFKYNSAVQVIAILLILAAIFVTGLFLFGRSIILKDGAQLEKQISKMYDGDYTFCPELNKNSPYADSCERLGKIAAQYRENIKKSIQAERTKIELVTNVSHDLKTPLTSIISYTELLSKEELSPAAADYVRILQNKSARLKAIISDVFELAKTTSGEIAVEHEKIDLSRLCHQTLGEMEDKISKSGLEVRRSIADPPVTIISDGKRIYRILQNLLDNTLKYSLKGTRVYFTLEKDEKQAVITIKNISSYEMTFTKEEILERFTRGDKARSTEGSGLGLSIAQGFTIACGGTFDIDLDGDMFKSIITFPLECPQQGEFAPQEIIEIDEQPNSAGAIPSHSDSENINSANSSAESTAVVPPNASAANEVKA